MVSHFCCNTQEVSCPDNKRVDTYDYMIAIQIFCMDSIVSSISYYQVTKTYPWFHFMSVAHATDKKKEPMIHLRNLSPWRHCSFVCSMVEQVPSEKLIYTMTLQLFAFSTENPQAPGKGPIMRKEFPCHGVIMPSCLFLATLIPRSLNSMYIIRTEVELIVSCCFQIMV